MNPALPQSRCPSSLTQHALIWACSGSRPHTSESASPARTKGPVSQHKHTVLVMGSYCIHDDDLTRQFKGNVSQK